MRERFTSIVHTVYKPVGGVFTISCESTDIMLSSVLDSEQKKHTISMHTAFTYQAHSLALGEEDSSESVQFAPATADSVRKRKTST